MKQSGPARRGDGLSPTDPVLLAAPLEFISEDNLRERQICAVIEELANSASFNRQAALTVLRFLNEELNVHVRDETEDLFPLLVRRCRPEDAIERAISRIRTDHDETTRLLPEVRAILERTLDTGGNPSTEDSKMLMSFATRMRRHLVAENAILLPIARARLTRVDLKKLSQRMRARRGLPPFSEASIA
ncbi:hemerythrin domain-containing protein [Hoeflea sp.]|uniref:hemerythrin domain-containing protein n=1 Tax=Hoeflea sp. TaxID=1940281 RepID=UPI0019A14133|nr:hemerythrin domain-containing protein [Hoeflea sp.]MBC7281596.1 hemerythrin domain-containing protein [Hoeflea sp.]